MAADVVEAQAGREQRRAEFVEHLDDRFLTCRTLGHSWVFFHDPEAEPPSWGVRLSMRCTGCEGVRHDVIDRRGEVSFRSYDMPEGYHAPKGLGATARPRFRTEVVRRGRVPMIKGGSR